MAIKFTDTQLVALSAASQRSDCCIAPSPQLRGAVATKFAEKLLAAEMVVEVAALKDMPIWRRNENGDAVAIQLTGAGLAAIGVVDEGAPAQSSATGSDSEDGAASRNVVAASPSRGLEALEDGPVLDSNRAAANVRSTECVRPKELSQPGADEGSRGKPEAHSEPRTAAPRPGSKLATLIVMITRPEGATVEELSASLGWLPHTTRAAITGLRKREYIVSLDKTDKVRGSVYRARDLGLDSADREQLAEGVHHSAAVGAVEADEPAVNDGATVQAVMVEDDAQ